MLPASDIEPLKSAFDDPLSVFASEPVLESALLSEFELSDPQPVKAVVISVAAVASTKNFLIRFFILISSIHYFLFLCLLQVI